MSTLMSYFNRLLPFATPGTPLLQDLLHLGAICVTLYFAPHLQEWHRRRQDQGGLGEHEATETGHDLEPDTLPVPAEHANPPEVDHGVQDAHAELNDEHHARGVELERAEDAEDAHEDDEAGPAAGPARVPEIASGRNVGAKKAKSLARKDQRRAYHEFQRSQGDMQRAKDAEDEAEREAALAAERERRRAVEAAVEAKKSKERERKRESERRDREEEIRRRELAVSIVREELEERRMCDLNRVARQVGDVDQEWVERIVTASGLVGRKGDVMTMITTTGWAVKVTAGDMAWVYQAALSGSLGDSDCKVSSEDLGGLLESLLRNG